MVLFYAVLALSAIQFIFRVSADFGTYYSVDMPLFIQTANDYLSSHTLYTRSDDLPQLYQPGAGVYKYPPLYQLTIVPWFAQGGADDVYFLALRIVMLLMYLGSAYLITKQAAALQGMDPKLQKYFYASATIITLWFDPFHAIHGVASEIYILFLVSSCIYIYHRKRFLSGIFLGLASMLKIYPAFIIGFSILTKNKNNIFGFIVGCTLSSALTIWYFGLSENIFFFSKILPVLLTEKMDPGVINLNIGSFFITNNLASGEALIFIFQKIFVGIILLLSSYKFKKETDIDLMNFLSLWICGMLLFLSNYWLQYQLILLIPVIVLTAQALNFKSNWKILVMIIIVIIMSLNDSLAQTFLENAMEKNHLTIGILMDTSKYASPIQAALQISPMSVLIYIAMMMRVFIPHILFILVILALRKNHEHNISR